MQGYPHYLLENCCLTLFYPKNQLLGLRCDQSFSLSTCCSLLLWELVLVPPSKPGKWLDLDYILHWLFHALSAFPPLTHIFTGKQWSRLLVGVNESVSRAVGWHSRSESPVVSGRVAAPSVGLCNPNGITAIWTGFCVQKPTVLLGNQILSANTGLPFGHCMCIFYR